MLLHKRSFAEQPVLIGVGYVSRDWSNSTTSIWGCLNSVWSLQAIVRI